LDESAGNTGLRVTTMTKSDLIDVLCETQKLPKGRAELLVHVIFDALEAALKRGERIEIRGFGSFELRNYRGYDGRNPRTGSAVEVRPKRLPFFKVGKELKERVNEGRLAAPRAGAKRAPVADEAAPINVAVPATGPVSTDSEATAAPPNARATA
jgi:integration host factor subunit beta